MEPHAHGRSGDEFDWAGMVAYAELEAELLAAFLAEAASELAVVSERDGIDVRRILDIGSGPGVGTCALATQFPSATVMAADGSPEMLANVVARAERLGLGARVTTRLVELPDGLDDLDRADAIWASMVLHHVGDEAAALRGLRRRLEPGGLVALAEFGDPTRFLPAGADLGRPGVWERLDAAGADWLAGMRAALPGATVSGDYPTMLAEAGFSLLTDRVMTVHLDAPLDDRARRLARAHLQMLRQHVGTRAEPDDLAVIDRLTDDDNPAGVMQRPDALLRASRRLLVARAVAP